ncbi:MAG TPA: YdcF family protein [Acidimicrobiales bacterium]|nr:YdcF family protein [Acidimicrobiales bacterium]
MIFGPIKLVLRIVATLISVVILYFAITFVQIWMTGHEHSTKHAQAILVFGTTENDGTPSPELRARLDQALFLWHKDRAPWIAVTGGKRPGDQFTEAGVSATYLEARGVPATKILKGSGTDTWRNVVTILSRLKSHDIKSVLTVTDPFHEDRAMAICSSQGLTPNSSPVRNSPTVKHSLWKYYLKETFEVGVGRIIGFQRFHSWFD